MFFGFNWVDFVVIIFVLIYAALIFRRGFFSEFFEFLGFLFSLLAALFLFSYPASFLVWLKIPSTLANSISFVSIWILFETLSLTVFRDLFRKIPMLWLMSKFNRYLGIFPNVAASLSIAIFVSTFALVLPAETSIKGQIAQSKILGHILPFTTSFNDPLEKAFSDSVRDGLIFVTSEFKPDKHSTKLNIPQTNFEVDNKSEEKLFQLLNQERLSLNLKEVKNDQALKSVAREHSKDMLENGYFGHINLSGKDPLYRISLKNIIVNTLAENISYAPDALTAHKSLMNSPDHRKAILSEKYTKVGVGVVRAENYGLMVTQLFASD